MSPAAHPDRTTFESRYADRSGTTVGQLHRLGLRAERCDCSAAGCEGWRMAPAPAFNRKAHPTDKEFTQ